MNGHRHHSRRGHTLGVLLMAIALAGCTVTQVETPDPAAIPTGSLVPQGEEATGDIIELGRGQALDTGWRYAIYPSGEDWCTQLETAAVTTTACGSLLPEGDATFGSVAQGDAAGLQTIEGAVTEETATVWMIGEGNLRAPATLMSLEPAGLDALAFVGFAPPDVVLTHLQAVAANGDVLDTYELP